MHKEEIVLQGGRSAGKRHAVWLEALTYAGKGKRTLLQAREPTVEKAVAMLSTYPKDITTNVSVGVVSFGYLFIGIPDQLYPIF